VSAASSIRGQSHPHKVGPLLLAHTAISITFSGLYGYGVSVAAGIRGRSHPRYAVSLLTAHTGTPFFPLTSPLYQRDPQSVKTCISLVNGIKINNNSALSMCNASIHV
jgi:hypothetical protein